MHSLMPGLGPGEFSMPQRAAGWATTRHTGLLLPCPLRGAKRHATAKPELRSDRPPHSVAAGRTQCDTRMLGAAPPKHRPMVAAHPISPVNELTHLFPTCFPVKLVDARKGDMGLPTNVFHKRGYTRKQVLVSTTTIGDATPECLAQMTAPATQSNLNLSAQKCRKRMGQRELARHERGGLRKAIPNGQRPEGRHEPFKWSRVGPGLVMMQSVAHCPDPDA